MELDDMKTAWVQQQKLLNATIRLNNEMLRSANTGAVRGALSRFSSGMTFEAVLNFVALLFLGSFAGDNFRDARYVIPAALLGICAIVLIVDGVTQIIAARTLDYDEPVVAIQKRVAVLRVRHVRTVRSVLLVAPALWTPLLIIGLRAAGVDAYATLGVTYLAANVAFSIAWLLAGFAVARYHGPRLRNSRLGNWLFDILAGHTLNAAVESLDNVIRFENEPAAA